MSIPPSIDSLLATAPLGLARRPEKARESSWAADLVREHLAAPERPAAPTAESLVRS